MIIQRATGNRAEWFMLLLGFALANPFALYLEINSQALQADRSFDLYLAIWTQGWIFFVVIFAIFWIILHFPSDHPPTPCWKWVNSVSIIGLVQFILASAFMETIGDENSEFFIDNPLGLIPARGRHRSVGGWTREHDSNILEPEAVGLWLNDFDKR